MKQILLIIALIAISRCQYLITEKWTPANQPVSREFKGPEFAELSELAVYGWLKIDPSISNDLSYNYLNDNDAGDNFLKLNVNGNQLFFNGCGQKSLVFEYIDYKTEERGQWIFFHISYSFSLANVNIFIKGPITQYNQNRHLSHKASDYYRLFFGKFEGSDMQKLSGTIANLYFQTGPGSYKEGGFEALYAKNPDPPIAPITPTPPVAPVTPSPPIEPVTPTPPTAPTDPIPGPANCIVIYSECYFKGNAVNLCEKIPISANKIKSIYFPPGARLQIVIPNPINPNQKVIYKENQSCIQSLNYAFSVKDATLKKRTHLKRNH